jgi:hypothetical protein
MAGLSSAARSMQPFAVTDLTPLFAEQNQLFAEQLGQKAAPRGLYPEKWGRLATCGGLLNPPKLIRKLAGLGYIFIDNFVS